MKLGPGSPPGEKLEVKDKARGGDEGSALIASREFNLSPIKEEKPMPGLNDLSRSAGRTKKYSRSLDSRQSLLPAVRRRSHPEPRVTLSLLIRSIVTLFIFVIDFSFLIEEISAEQAHVFGFIKSHLRTTYLQAPTYIAVVQYEIGVDFRSPVCAVVRPAQVSLPRLETVR